MRIITRNKDLKISGDISYGAFKITARDEWNGRGGWTLELPLDHPSARALNGPGDGIVILDDDGTTEFSGSVRSSGTTSCAREIVTKNGIDVLTVSGISDLGLLWRRRMVPPVGQTHSNHTGDVGVSLCAAVAAHLGVNASTNRRIVGLVTAPATIGRNQTVKGRYASLGDIMSLAAFEAGVAMSLQWVNAELVFKVLDTIDTQMPMSLAGGSAVEIEETHTPDDATAVIGLGNGVGTARLVVTVEATQDPWARTETTVDTRQDYFTAPELAARASEEYVIGGRSLKVEPAPGLDLPKLGNRVTAVDSVGVNWDLPVVERRIEITPSSTRRTIILGEQDWTGLAGLVRPATASKDFE